MSVPQSQQQVINQSVPQELNQSKYIIKEALLSNPSLLSNIIINLEEKEQEEPTESVDPHPMEIFQESEQNKIQNNNENSKAEKDHQEENQQNQKQEGDYQFQETNSAQQQRQEQYAEQEEQPQKSSKKNKESAKASKKPSTNKAKKSQNTSKKNSKTDRDDDQQYQEQQNKSEQQQDKKPLAKMRSKKEQKKQGKAEISPPKTTSSKTKKNMEQKTNQDEVPTKNTKNTQKEMKQCNFQIVIKQDKQIQQILAQKSKPINAFQKQKQLKSVQFWVEIALLSNNYLKETKPKSTSQYKKKPSRKAELEEQKANDSQDPYYQSYRHPYQQEERMYQDEQEQISSKKIKQKEKINLGHLSLLQIVTILKNEGLLKPSLYDKFRNNHTQHDLEDFIQKFSTGQLATFDYKLIPFTLLDHRRLAELIFNLFPDKYYIGDIYSENEEVCSFLVTCYDLQSEKYYKLYKNIDQVSKIEWWMELIVDNRKKIDQAFKIKNANKVRNPEARQSYRRNLDQRLRQKKNSSKKNTNHS